MSGGYYDYHNDDLGYEIFGYNVSIGYDLANRQKDIDTVRKMNPMEDKLISELVYDVFCLLHSYDWYRSGDCCEESYRKDVDYFKQKWFKTIDKEEIKELIKAELDVAKQNLETMLIYGKDDSQ